MMEASREDVINAAAREYRQRWDIEFWMLMDRYHIGAGDREEYGRALRERGLVAKIWEIQNLPLWMDAQVRELIVHYERQHRLQAAYYGRPRTFREWWRRVWRALLGRPA